MLQKIRSLIAYIICRIIDHNDPTLSQGNAILFSNSNVSTLIHENVDARWVAYCGCG